MKPKRLKPNWENKMSETGKTETNGAGTNQSEHLGTWNLGTVT